jgi:hypothetical protein
MEPRIEYQSPLGPSETDRVARGDRVRGERRSRRQNSNRRRSKREKQADRDDEGTSDVTNPRDPEKLGRRIDMEA